MTTDAEDAGWFEDIDPRETVRVLIHSSAVIVSQVTT